MKVEILFQTATASAECCKNFAPTKSIRKMKRVKAYDNLLKLNKFE